MTTYTDPKSLAFEQLIYVKDLGDKSECVANFYEIEPHEKKYLLDFQKQLDKIHANVIKNPASLALSGISMNTLMDKMRQVSANFEITSLEDSTWQVGFKAQLKSIYQTQEHIKPEILTPSIFSLYSVEWVESERGWGTRPDGFSFHLSQEEAKKFVKKYQDGLPDQVPDEYSRPCLFGEDPSRLIEVSQSLYSHVMKNGSVWLDLNNASVYKTYDASQLKRKP